MREDGVGAVNYSPDVVDRLWLLQLGWCISGWAHRVDVLWGCDMAGVSAEAMHVQGQGVGGGRVQGEEFPQLSQMGHSQLTSSPDPHVVQNQCYEFSQRSHGSPGVGVEAWP